MRDRDLDTQILGIRHTWTITDVKLDVPREEVRVHVEADRSCALGCPECGVEAPRHDHRERQWRHLDTCHFRTILVADVPRVNCPEHGVKQCQVPWAEPHAGFTALFEALAIGWLREASISAVARLLKLTWHEVDGIMWRAVRRGLARRQLRAPSRMGVDETSFQKRHEYVTVVTDLDGSTVLYVADDRKAESLAGFYRSLKPRQRQRIAIVAMAMHQPYIKATRDHLPDADEKIAFDKFHVAQHLGDAVDRVRREEHRLLMAEGDWTFKDSKYLWLQNPDNMSDVHWDSSFKILRESNLKTARAWALKEAAMWVWTYAARGRARRALERWYAWAARSRLEPMKKVAKTIKNHLEGILNAIVSRATNAAGESVNAKIQRVKRLACGFRNRERFRNAIYFHCGGLDLYPVSAGITHTKP
jgi:transposase